MLGIKQKIKEIGSRMNSTVNLDRLITKDDVQLINKICSGRSLDFTTEFMQCLPQLIEVAQQLGWIEGGHPDIQEGSYLSVNGAVRWYGEDKPQVTGALVYMNRYNLNVEQMDEVNDPTCKIERTGGDTFYTGWALLEAGNERNCPYFDFLQDHQVVAWKPLPVYPGE